MYGCGAIGDNPRTRAARAAAAMVSVLAILGTMSALGCADSAGNADGGGDGAATVNVFSCTVSQNDGTRTYDVLCIEGTAALRPTVESACAGPDAGQSAGGATHAGHFAQAPCSHDGAVGGCRIAFGGNAQTSWYYGGAGFTAAQVQQVCSGPGSTFVTP